MLITRPGPGGTGAPLGRLLHDRGATPLFRPLTELRRADESYFEEVRASLRPYDAPPVTLLASARGAELAGELYSLLPDLYSGPVFAVGDATAAVARERGFSNVAVVAKNHSAGLATAALEARACGNIDAEAPFVAVRSASGRREGLETLTRAGVPLIVANLYDTRIVDTVATLEAPVDWVTLMSPLAAFALVRHFGGARRGELFHDATGIVTIGPTTTATCMKLGLDVQKQAASPSVQALVEAIFAP